MFRKTVLVFALLLHAANFYGLQEEQITPPPPTAGGPVEVPWFTGPLFAPSALIVPVGSWAIQPYIYAIQTPAVYDNHWKAQSIPTLWSLAFEVPVWVGLTDWIDIQFQQTLTWNHKQGFGSNWALGNALLQFNMQLYSDSLPYNTGWMPSVKFSLYEILPTGKYRNLSPKKSGLDAGGNGSWATGAQVVFGKLFQLSGYYFLSTRLSLAYTLPALVHVKGFNVYGGGFGTNGTIRPGQNFQWDFGMEVSLSRNWALALDVIGVYQSKSTFSGRPGIRLPGPAPVSVEPQVPSEGSTAINDVNSFIQYSIAPAIEYNFNAAFGIIAGTWFTFAGKNTSKFYSAVISFSYFN